MAKHYKIIVNLLKGEEAINLAVQNGKPLRIWVVEGANYLLQAEDEQAALAPLAVKAKRMGKDLQLMFDGAQSPQVVLIGYFDVALEGHTPLLGRMPDGSLREYSVLDADGAHAEATVLPDGAGLAELVLADESRAAVAALAPLAVGPGALAAIGAGLAAAGGGGGGGSGGGAPALTPEQALQHIQQAAKDNTASDLSARVYQTAGVSGVTDANVGAINDVLNSAAVTDATLPGKAQVQSVVDAYVKVLQAADHVDGNMADVPTLDDYNTLALTGVSAASAKLLSDVVDGKSKADVDSVTELQALADAVQAVITCGMQGAGAPTAEQINGLLAGLPVMGNVVVSSEAEKAVQNAILAANTDANGAIASQGELADIVKTAVSAFGTSLARIRSFASTQQSGIEGQAIPIEAIPTLADYNNVGVSGVNEGNRGAVNDALASKAVEGSVGFPLSNLQAVIDAYNTILAAANGAAQHPGRADYAAVGADIGSAMTDAQNLALLNEAVGVQKAAGVDTVAEINNLARITNGIGALAAGQSPSPALTVEDLARMGLNVQGLSDNNASQKTALFNAIAAKADDGTETDSLKELQDIITAVLAGSVGPVVLDMNGDGALSYTTLLMDVNGDGVVDKTAWVGAQDGVLVREVRADGQLTPSLEFAFARNRQETDVQGLAARFDSNHDGQLNAQDAAFGAFRVWQDANGNGASDVGELHRLPDLGIVSIDLNSDGVWQNPAAGVTEMGRVHATRGDGSQLLGADAAFDYTAAQLHATPLVGDQWRLDVAGEHQSLNLSNLRAVFGDVRELHLEGQGGHALSLQLEDVLAQPLQIKGDASTVVTLFTGEANVGATSVVREGVAYLAYDGNHDGHLDLLIQQGVSVNVHGAL